MTEHKSINLPAAPEITFSDSNLGPAEAIGCAPFSFS